jgi:hypothetical protein
MIQAMKPIIIHTTQFLHHMQVEEEERSTVLILEISPSCYPAKSVNSDYTSPYHPSSQAGC